MGVAFLGKIPYAFGSKLMMAAYVQAPKGIQPSLTDS